MKPRVQALPQLQAWWMLCLPASTKGTSEKFKGGTLAPLKQSRSLTLSSSMRQRARQMCPDARLENGQTYCRWLIGCVRVQEWLDGLQLRQKRSLVRPCPS